ncbi:MAG: hypothetical protein LUF35_03625 [Lachnospiraceae bacterium]|nr:hypothetical protein [Lachnospiraceae bacterium]
MENVEKGAGKERQESREGKEGGRGSMILTEIYERTVQTGIGHSSKGNQLKWFQDGWWYKADGFGFESLAETVVSTLLEHSALRESYKYDFVRYEPVMIRYKGQDYRGCRSRNFKGKTEELVPLERLSRIYTGFSLAEELARIADMKQRIVYTEKLVRNVTGMADFGVYLTRMLEIDAFFLNEDRHTNNIAVLYDTETKKWRLCPFFDMGLSLFSDTREDYPLEKSFAECREHVLAKPFSSDFDEQLDAASELYGTFLKFDFPAGRIMETLGQDLTWMAYSQMENSEEKIRDPFPYTPEEVSRVEEALRYQARKYRYMFP